MIKLTGKRILFIGNGFYNYENNIINEFEERGATVFYFPTSIALMRYVFFFKILYSILPEHIFFNLIAPKVGRYIRKQPSNIDYIFINKGVAFRKKQVDILKNKYPNVPTVLYFWDSLARVENSQILLDEFPFVMTFDRVDSVNYKIPLRPLFYIRKENCDDKNILYDVSFVGNMHSIRLKVLRQIKNEFKKYGIKYNFKLYMNKYKYWLNRYVFHIIDSDDEDIITTTVIPYEDYLEISRCSNVIFDISHPLQSGLTIRTIESIGLGKKILTTNKDIINYHFPTNMVSVFVPQNAVIDVGFIKDHYIFQYDSSKFSLSHFVDDIINEWNKQSGYEC